LNVASQAVPAATETLTYERTKPTQRTPHGREDLPAHLRREEVVIMPQEDVSAMTRIGEKVTEQLHYKEAQCWVKRYVRPVFAGEINGVRTIRCGQLPALCNEKGKFGSSFIAHATVAKFEDHTPLYRLGQQLRRDSGMDIAESTLDKIPEIAAFWLAPIAGRLSAMLMAGGYVQMDESTLRVMIQPTNGKSTRGYMWLRNSPELKIVSFHYDRHRDAEVARRLLGNYQGILQTDGYVVYDAYSNAPGIIHAGCHAHARRGFEESLHNDKCRAAYALEEYRRLFDVERDARERNLSPDDRLALRKEKAEPIIAGFKGWLDAEVHTVRPKSRIGKAMLYCLGRWKELVRFLEDGRIELSNNLVENPVRPFALGRKNWLFAGSEDAARRMATIYTIQGTCKLHGVNLFRYLTHLLDELPSRRASDIDDLLPMNWKPPP
jgi:transposase